MTETKPAVMMPSTRQFGWPDVAGACVVLFAVWLEVASRLRFEWSINPQYGYGWTVPFAAAYLLWRRWSVAPLAQNPRRRFFSIAVIIIAPLIFIPARLVQEANPDWRLISWAIAIAATTISYAVIYLIGGKSWLRHFAFPIAFFLVSVPWPTNVENVVIQGLMRLDSSLNVHLLNVLGIPAVQYGNVIEIGTGLVGIDEACTGVRSLQATLMVSLFLGELYGFTVARRFALVAAGAVLAFTCNLIRTFLLVWIGAHDGADAIKRWHDPAGMTILTACIFGLWGVSMWMSRGHRENAMRSTLERHVRPLPIALCVLVVTCLATAEIGTAAWYRNRENARPKVTSWSVEWPASADAWQVVPIAENAQELLRYNEGGGGQWLGADSHPWNLYFFRWLPGRTAGLFIKNHRPDICLPASGMTQRGSAISKVIDIRGIALPMRAYVFEHGSETFHVYYCYWDGSAPTAIAQNDENWTAGGRLQAVKAGKRDVGTQMLELIVLGYESDEAAESAAREELARVIKPAAKTG